MSLQLSTLFVIAVVGTEGVPYISPPVIGGWLAWQIFLTHATSKHTVSVSCRHAEHHASWHSDRGFTSIDLEDA